MFCMNCGEQLEDGLKFCTACGTPVNIDEATQAQVDKTTSLLAAQPTMNPTPGQTQTPTLTSTPIQTPTSPQASVSASAYQQASVSTSAYQQAPVSATASAPLPSYQPAPTPAFGSVPAPASVEAFSQSRDYPQMGQGPVGSPQKSKAPLIIAIVAVVVVIAAVLTFLFVIKPAQEEAQQASKGLDVSVTFSGGEYVASASTPVVVSVKGTTFDNEGFNETYFIKGNDRIELPYGSYTLMPMGSPMGNDGTLYSINPTSVKFSVSSSGVSEPLNFSMTKISAIDVTDSQIQSAVDAARLADVSSSEISTLRQKIESARSDAKKKQEEAKTTQNSKTYLTVVNCEEWISLRVSPSTSADRIVKIPLGEKVEYLGVSSNGFAKVTWHGMTGWSLWSYLS